MTDCRQNVRFVYDLPYKELKLLCQILDCYNKWEELGGKYMRFDMITIHDLRRGMQRGSSPTEELLTLWGHQNHTVTELFVLLSKMQHYQAMRILKPFVESRFHPLIYEGEGNLSRFFGGSKGKPVYPRNSDQIQESTPEMETPHLQDVAGALTNNDPPNELPGPSNHNPLLDKNLNMTNHNLNSAMPNTSPSKVIFPPEQAGERKILNTPETAIFSNENNLVQSLQNIPSSVHQRLQPQPPVQEGAAGLQADNKENNAPQPNTQRKMSNASDASSVAEFCCTIPQIEYKELMVATNGWDKQSILGKGGFGTVFKGLWKNTMVAIKRIEQRGAESTESYQAQMEQSLRELRILNACRHDNILPLYGYSMGGDDPCLVYQFMPNGSLEDRLLCRQGTKPLSWTQRHNIAEGTARGLQFLHTNKKPFIHGDIKSANILLDTNFEPRIGDFGLAREGPQNQYTHMKVSRVHGTRPYLPDEFLRGKHLSTKVDTYSFGIVLFELATGLRAYDDSRPTNKFLRDYVGAFEEQQLWTLCDVKVGSYGDTFLHLISLGKLCVSKRAKDRPEMEEVLKQLEMYRRIVSRAQQMVCRNERQVLLDHLPSPLPYQLPLSVSPEPVNRNNMAMGMKNVISAIYQQPPHTNMGQINPTSFPPIQPNNPLFEINYPHRLIVHHEENGNSQVPSAEDRLLQKVHMSPSHGIQEANINQIDHQECIGSGVSKNRRVSPIFLPQTRLNSTFSASPEISATPRQIIPTVIGSFSQQPIIAVSPPSLSPALSNESLPPTVINNSNIHLQDMPTRDQSPGAGAYSDSDGLPLISILGIKNSGGISVQPNHFQAESITTAQHSLTSSLLQQPGSSNTNHKPKEITAMGKNLDSFSIPSSVNVYD